MVHSYAAAALVALLAGRVGAAAPVPPDPPLRAKEPPAAWKLADLNALLPRPDDAGPLAVLAWEVIDCGEEVGRLDRCLVVKAYAAPRPGESHALGYLLRWNAPGQEKAARWREHWIGLPPKAGAPRELVGVASFNAAPTAAELAAFLRDRTWDEDLKPHEITIAGRGTPRRLVKVVPKLLDGGVSPAAWKKSLGRAPPAAVFPELRESPPQAGK